MRNARNKLLSSKFSKVITLAAFSLLTLVQTAFAGDNGAGLLGEHDDKIITFFGLGLVILFPLIAGVASFIQGRLERRADERKSSIYKHK